MIAIIPGYGNRESTQHEVVYIEYQDGAPHSIGTISKSGCVYWWDAFFDEGREDDLKLYNAGSGGTTISGPHYRDDYKGGSYWKSETMKFDKEPINCAALKEPIDLEILEVKSTNPFDVGEICYDSQYCNVCERKKKGSGHRSTYCDDHTYTDSNGDLRYFNHKYVQ